MTSPSCMCQGYQENKLTYLKTKSMEECNSLSEKAPACRLQLMHFNYNMDQRLLQACNTSFINKSKDQGDLFMFPVIIIIFISFKLI